MPWVPPDPSLGLGNDLGIDWSSENHTKYECDDKLYSDENSDPHPSLPRTTVQHLTDGINKSLRKPVIVESQLYGVLVDGFYRKHVDHGGYGVIIVDATGTPIAALSAVSEDGAISEYYHTLEGIRAGLIFARKHGITKICMGCNDDYIRDVIEHCFQPSKHGCFCKDTGFPGHQNFDTFCVTCML